MFRRSMLCEKCKHQEAVIHLTEAVDDRISAADLCPDCFHISRPCDVPVEHWLGSLPGSFGTPRGCISSELIGERWFPEDAYDFVIDALACALAQVSNDSEHAEHVTSGQLLDAFRELAIQRWGKDAKAHLSQWSVLRTEDIGEIVYNMVEAGSWAISNADKKEDFSNGYDFGEAFPEE